MVARFLLSIVIYLWIGKRHPGGHDQTSVYFRAEVISQKRESQIGGSWFLNWCSLVKNRTFGRKGKQESILGSHESLSTQPYGLWGGARHETLTPKPTVVKMVWVPFRRRRRRIGGIGGGEKTGFYACRKSTSMRCVTRRGRRCCHHQ